MINDHVAIDVGALGFSASLERQRGVEHVFISHTHIDHLASLPVLLENAYDSRPQCITVHGSEAVLDCLRRDLFNDRLWPNFIQLSETAKRPFLRLAQITEQRAISVCGLSILPVTVNHVVPTHGFIVDDGTAAIVIASDTAPTELVWQLANQQPRLRAVFLEASFPERMSALAAISKHLTPRQFAAEARKLKREVRFIAVHIKAAHRDLVVAELAAQGLSNIEVGISGREYQF